MGIWIQMATQNTTNIFRYILKVWLTHKCPILEIGSSLCCTAAERNHTCPLPVASGEIRNGALFQNASKTHFTERAVILLRQIGNEVIILYWRDYWTYFLGPLKIKTNSHEKSFNEIQSVWGRKQRQSMFPILFVY